LTDAGNLKDCVYNGSTQLDIISEECELLSGRVRVFVFQAGDKIAKSDLIINDKVRNDHHILCTKVWPCDIQTKRKRITFFIVTHVLGHQNLPCGNFMCPLSSLKFGHLFYDLGQDKHITNKFLTSCQR